MNIHDLQRLLSALANKQLKGKNLSADSFFSVLCIKKKGAEHINNTIEAEAELANEYGIDLRDENAIGSNIEFSVKLKLLQKDFTYQGLNFMSKEEFKSWTDEIDIESAYILFEHLVKADK